MKLYLMRHGETLFNTQKRVQGWCDSPLTENGICQAEQAKQYFAKKGISFDAVYSSTQERATDTAKIVAPEYLLPKHRPGLRSFEDLLVPYGGEDIRKVGQRVLKTVIEKAEKHIKEGAENLLFVSHGAALWGLIIFMDLAFPEGVGFGNCNVCVYDYNQGQLELLQVIDPISGLEVTL